jgi:hypothetical protein
MSVRKIAGLAAAFSLAVGLIGAGVSAQFTDSVKAKENINVGTFQCKIVDPSMGNVTADGKSLVYTAPEIDSSAPSSAPFTFTVQNTGSIADVLTVSTSPAISAPWSIIGAPFAPVVVAGGGPHLYNTGIKWTELDNSNLSQSGSVTWTVSCNELPTKFTTFGPATVTEGPTGTYTIVSVVGPCEPYAVSCPLWGGVDLTYKNSGKLIGDVAFSFTSSGQAGGGAPRFSLPISTDGTSTIALYAFLSADRCGPGGPPTVVSTTLSNCIVDLNSTLGGTIANSYANWAAFVTAHPTYEIAPGAMPFIVADGTVGTYIVSNISE